MQVLYVNGQRLKHAFIAGAEKLISEYKYLNKINVYPVADGDTGTNLAGTMNSIVAGLEAFHSKSIEQTGRQIADLALMSARGNSGAIFAQFLQGFSDALRGRHRINVDEFGSAVVQASQSARMAVLKPVEGTILTVMKVFSDSVSEGKRHYRNFNDLFNQTVKDINQGLIDSKQLLDELKKHNVVDAGAQGFVYFIEGIFSFLLQGKLEAKAITHLDFENTDELDLSQTEDLECPYCCEFVLDRLSVSFESIREKLATYGNSLVLAGNERKAKIHIHTNQPETLFNYLESISHIVQDKVDNMQQQITDAHKQDSEIAIVVDSACDLTPEILKKFNIHVIPVRLYFGQISYIDRLTISNERFYQKLQEGGDYPKTSLPNPADVKRMYQTTLPYYKQIISIHIPKKSSGTYQSILNMAKQISKSIHVIDANSISVGIGLLVYRVAQMVSEKKSIDEILVAIPDLISKLSIVINVQDISYAIRGGRVSKAKGFIGKLLQVKPLLSFSEDGQVITIDKAYGAEMSHKKTLSIIMEKARELQNPLFSIGHANALDLANTYKQNILAVYPTATCFICEISPALGVHGGPGTIGVAVSGDL